MVDRLDKLLKDDPKFIDGLYRERYQLFMKSCNERVVENLDNTDMIIIPLK